MQGNQVELLLFFIRHQDIKAVCLIVLVVEKIAAPEFHFWLRLFCEFDYVHGIR